MFVEFVEGQFGLGNVAGRTSAEIVYSNTRSTTKTRSTRCVYTVSQKKVAIYMCS